MTQTLSKNVIADFSTQLAVKMAVGATTGTLASATDSDSVALPTGTYFLTIDKNNSKKEYIKCTLTGTALTSIQSISRQGALTSGTAREHRVGANVIISDFASLSKMNDVLTGVTSFDSATPLGYDGTASITTDNQFATKAYVDSSSIPSSYLDTDGTLAANSDVKVASQKATKTYADTKLSKAGGTMTAALILSTSSPSTSLEAASKGYADGLAIAGSPDSSTTVKGIGQVSVAPVSPTTPIFVGDNDPRVPTQSENDALAGTGTPSSSNKYVTADTLNANIKFGGTGADGALAITSGTTTIDLGGALYVEKNYTSISITGTGQLAFSNPHALGTIIKLRSQGAVTLTSSASPNIDVTAMGGEGGTSTGSNNSMVESEPGKGYFGTGALRTKSYNSDINGQNGNNIASATNNLMVAVSGTATVNQTFSLGVLPPISQYGEIFPGGGGGGSAFNDPFGNRSGGTGGRGGGALDIECAGALNFTGTIWSKGTAGSAGTNVTAGKGAGGTVRILCNSITANTGTIDVSISGGNAGQSLVAVNNTVA